jgi:hypothetical protein
MIGASESCKLYVNHNFAPRSLRVRTTCLATFRRRPHTATTIQFNFNLASETESPEIFAAENILLLYGLVSYLTRIELSRPNLSDIQKSTSTRARRSKVNLASSVATLPVALVKIGTAQAHRWNYQWYGYLQ